MFLLDETAPEPASTGDTTATTVIDNTSELAPRLVDERIILEPKSAATNLLHFGLVKSAFEPVEAATAIKTRPEPANIDKPYLNETALEPKPLTSSFLQFGITGPALTTGVKTIEPIKASVINDSVLEPKSLTTGFLQFGLDESAIESSTIKTAKIKGIEKTYDAEAKPLGFLPFGVEEEKKKFDEVDKSSLLFGLDEGLDSVCPTAVKIAAEPKLLCGGWGGQSTYALDGCVETGLLRPPPQPHSSQLGTVYATKRRRRNGKR